jgi:hypothetical protein
MNGHSTAHKFLTVITFLNVLAAMGCETSPVSPSQDDTMPGVENPMFARVLTTSEGSSDRGMLLSSSTSVSMVVSAETGGTVTNGYVSLYFPPNALAEDTEITIDMPRFPEAVVQLGPHGIVFNKEVSLIMPLARIDSNATAFQVLWYNEDCGRWVAIGEEVDDGNVVSKLRHFSDYGYDPIQ